MLGTIFGKLYGFVLERNKILRIKKQKKTNSQWAKLKGIKAWGQASFQKGIFTFDPHSYITYFNQTRSICKSESLFILFFVNFSRSFWQGSTWQALGMLVTFRRTITFITRCQCNVHHNLSKNSNQHRYTWWRNVWHVCAFSPASFGSCIAKLQMCLEETNMDTPYLFNRMVAIFLYADNVVMLFHHD